MGFKAINERAGPGAAPAGESYEAKEGRLVAEYEGALRLLAQGGRAEALAAFQALLGGELLAAAAAPGSQPTETVRRVRFLALRNQAEMLAADDASAGEALRLYLAALEGAREDGLLWHHAGALAAELAEWGVARHALEQALRLSPGNVLVAERLLEVLLRLRDHAAAGGVAAHLLRVHPGHPRASALVAALSRAGAGASAPASAADAAELRPRFPARLRTSAPPAPAGPAALDVPQASWRALLQALVSHIERGSPAQQQSAGILQVTVGREAVEAALQRHEQQQAAGAPAEEAAVAPGAAPSSEAAAPEGSGAGAAGAPDCAGAEAGTAPAAEGGAGDAAAPADGQALPPQRASRRLVAKKRKAKTKGSSEGEGGTEAQQRNVIAMLARFLGPRPPAAAQPPAAPGAPPPAALLPAPPAREQAGAVLRLLAEAAAAGGAGASAPQLAAAAAGRLTAGAPERLLPEGVPPLLLQLDLLLGGWERAPGSALTLAELHLDCVAALASSPKPSREAAAKEAAQCRRHLQAARGNLGHYALAAAGGQLASLARAERRRLRARQLWAQARLWEHAGRDAEAAGAFAGCLALCRGERLPGGQPWLLEPGEAASGGGGAAEPCTVVLANCARDALLSADALPPRIANAALLARAAAAPALLREGRREEVVASLAPACLGGEAAAGLDRACHVRALGTLKDALAGLEGERWLGAELLTRLLHVSRKLRRVPDDVDDAALHTAPLAGRAPPPGVDVGRALRPAGNPGGKPQSLLQLAAAADRAAAARARGRAWQAGAVPGLALEPLGAGRLQALVREAQWKLLASAERAYWAVPPPGRKSARPDLDEMNREVLVCSLAAIASLQQLDGTSESSAPDATLGLLGACLQLAQERRAAGAAEAALPHACLRRLARALEAPPPGADANDLEQLEAARAQLLYLVYGVDFDHRDDAWGGPTQEPEEAREALGSAADCLAVWPHLQSYAEAADGVEPLARLKGVFARLAAVFPPPPEAALAGDATLRLLDGPLPTLQELLEGPADGLLPEPAAPPAAQAPEAGVRAGLYALQLRAEAGTLDLGGRPDGEAAAEALDRCLALARADLHFCPRRHATWAALAGCYGQALAALQEQKHAPGPEERQLQRRLRQRALRAGAVARLLLPPADASLAGRCEHELGELLLAEAGGLEQGSDARTWHCRQAVAAFERAAAALPEEWRAEHALGRARSELGEPAARVLRHHARAASLASALLGGRVEPLFRLHAVRLEALLQGGRADVAAAERHCFLEATPGRLAQLRAGAAPSPPAAKRQRLSLPWEQAPPAPASSPAACSAEARQALVEDCRAAMAFCLDWSRGFHPARFALARAAERLGEGPAAAAEHLRPLFPRGSSGRRALSVAVDLIQDPDARAWGEGRRGERLEAGAAAEVPEAEWGRPPPRVAGVGRQESAREHAAAARKYLACYLRLLAAARDAALLQAATHGLRLPATRAQFPQLPDMLPLAQGMLLTVVADTASTLLADAFVPQQPGAPAAGGEWRRPLTDAEVAALELAFATYAEHSPLLDGAKAGQWEGGCGPALAACQADQGARDSLPAVPPEALGEAAFGAFARGYLAHLGQSSGAERLEPIAARALRRLRTARASDRSARALPDEPTAAALAAACARCLPACLQRLEHACGERARALAEERQRADEGPASPEPAAAAPPDAAEPAQGERPPSQSPPARGGSPAKRARTEAAEGPRRGGRSPPARPPEDPLRALAVEAFRWLGRAHGLHRACRQLAPADAARPEAQADRDALLVRAAVAYIQAVHGQGVRLAPLGVREAEALCAELARQAGREGGAPLPSLGGRTLAEGAGPAESPALPPPAQPEAPAQRAQAAGLAPPHSNGPTAAQPQGAAGAQAQALYAATMGLLRLPGGGQRPAG